MTTGRRLTLLGFLVAATIVGVSLFLRQPVTFGLVAETERLEFTVADDSRQAIDLSHDNGVVVVNDAGRILCGADVTGEFEPGGGAEANYRRVGHGNVELTFTASGDDLPAGLLNVDVEGFGGGETSGDDERDLNDGSLAAWKIRPFCEAEIPRGDRVAGIRQIAISFENVQSRFRNGRPVRIPIAAGVSKSADDTDFQISSVEFGAAEGIADLSSEPLLYSAKVTLLSGTIVGKQIFVGGEVDLGLGDRVQFLNPRTTGVGLALAGDRPGFSVTYRTVAEAAWVTRYRSDGYAITISRYQRFLNDPIIKGFWGAALALIAFAGKFGFDLLRARRSGDADPKTG